MHTTTLLAAIARGDDLPSRRERILAAVAAGEVAPAIAAREGVADAYVAKLARKAGLAVAPSRRGPKRLDERVPLSPWHEAVGRAVFKWRRVEHDLGENEFGLLVGLSRFRVLDAEAGTADLSMTELMRLAAVVGELPPMTTERPRVRAG